MLRSESASLNTAFIARSWALQVSLARKARVSPKSTPMMLMKGGATPCRDSTWLRHCGRCRIQFTAATASRVPSTAAAA